MGTGLCEVLSEDAECFRPHPVERRELLSRDVVELGKLGVPRIHECPPRRCGEPEITPGTIECCVGSQIDQSRSDCAHVCMGCR